MKLNFLKRNNDLGLLILRVSVAFLMLMHGMAKVVYGIDPIMQMVLAKGLPSFVAYGVYVGEVIAPLFMIVGFRARLAAAVFAFNCVVAASLAHAGDILSMGDTGGWAVELLGLYFFGAVAVIFTGAGKHALSYNNMWD